MGRDDWRVPQSIVATQSKLKGVHGVSVLQRTALNSSWRAQTVFWPFFKGPLVGPHCRIDFEPSECKGVVCIDQAVFGLVRGCSGIPMAPLAVFRTTGNGRKFSKFHSDDPSWTKTASPPCKTRPTVPPGCYCTHGRAQTPLGRCKPLPCTLKVGPKSIRQ